MPRSPVTSAATVPALPYAEVRPWCHAELDLLLPLLRSLGPGDWSRPTDCGAWTVQDVAAHVLGQFHGQAHPIAYLTRHRRAHRRYPQLTRLDADNQSHLDDFGALAPDQLIDAIERTGRRAIDSSARIPAPMRRMSVARLYPDETLTDPTLGYVFGVLNLRDPWMHRFDISRATSGSAELGAHDRTVVEQAVAELARFWTGLPVTLDLTGPAGGTWSLATGSSSAPDAPLVQVDALEFMLLLSGRPAHPEFTGADAPLAAHLNAARVVF